MLSLAGRPEIDHRTIKLLVGVIAITLAPATAFLAGNTPIESISVSYHGDGLGRDVFVGALLAVAAFLFAYNGKSLFELVLSKVACGAAAVVALAPCKCANQPPCEAGGCLQGTVSPHGAAAGIMFLALVVFCYLFFGRARVKEHPQARIRAWLYAACGLTILSSILVIFVDSYTLVFEHVPRLVFWGEAVALFAFGIAWLLASRVLPLITHREERKPLLPIRKSAI